MAKFYLIRHGKPDIREWQPDLTYQYKRFR